VQGIERRTDHVLLRATGPNLLYYQRQNRCYRLVGDRLVNAWTEHEQEYMEVIGNAVYSATTVTALTDGDAQSFAENLYEILVAYDAIEQRDAGWRLVQDLVTEAKATHRLADGTTIDQVFMPTMERLYKENRAFVPPETAVSSRPETSFYDWDG